MKKWRSGSVRTINARPIKKIEYPILVKAFKEDGVHAQITEKGVVWFHGEYKIVRSHLCEMWEITTHQMKKFETHILEKNPFGGYYEGNDYLNG